MSHVNTIRSRATGFTLVEMLIIAPLALLVIAGFIALMVTMVGDAIANHNRNSMTFDIQSALNSIEQDVRLSTQFLDTSGTLITPQGKNDSTSAFTSTSGDLILGEIATTKNPLDPTRGFVYYNAPFNCNTPSQVFKNPIYFNTIIYFVRNGSLWRRTYVPNPSGTPCNTPWQVNSCFPGYTNTTRCKTSDSEIMDNVDSISISYYVNPEDTTPVAASAAKTASTIKVTINGKQTAAGRTFTSSAATRVSKLTSKDITMGPPASPTVNVSVSGTQATFSWAAVANASSYIVTYNINGGPWITASDNTTETSWPINGYRGDIITLKVLARNEVGTSADAASNTKAATIPRWIDCNLQNSWVNYNNGYETCGYTISKDGIVMLKGHIKSGSIASNVALFQLPPELRPSTTLMFQTVINPNSSTRINVNTDGWVRLDNGSSSTYLGLDGISFIPASSSLYNWSNLTLQNGWTNHGGTWSDLQTTKDTTGRVHVRGLIDPGTTTTDVAIAQLPAGSTVSEYYHVPARGSVFSTLGINTSGAIVARGITTTYQSVQLMLYPSTFGGWQSFSGAVAGNPADNQLGNNWVTYGGTQTVPQYTKAADGIVTLKGLIKNGTTTDLTYMAKLPPGYRPLKTLAFVAVTNGNAVARIDVGESGYLIFRAGSNTWLSLDGISYMAEQ